MRNNGFENILSKFITPLLDYLLINMIFSDFPPDANGVNTDPVQFLDVKLPVEKRIEENHIEQKHIEALGSVTTMAPPSIREGLRSRDLLGCTFVRAEK